MVIWWDDLRTLYLNARSPGQRDGLAVALMASATKAQFDDLLALASDDSLDDTRIYFLKPLKRLDRVRGAEFVESRVDDPVLGREASRLTRRSKKRQAAG